MLTFIDTHAHLNSKQFDADLKKVITSSKKAGVKKIIVPGFDFPTSIKSLNIAGQFKGVCFGTCGIHPYHANKISDLFEVRKKMIEIIEKYKPVAVGEVGLDYHLYKNEEAKGKKEQQKELLRIEIELALQYKLPVIFHCRRAWDDYIEILEEYIKDGLKGVSHCFEGGNYYLQKIISMGFFVGFNGLITHNHRLEDIVKETPVDKILLETDSPFLTPVELRGQRNEPKNIRIIAKFIAKLKTKSLEEIVNFAFANSEKLFKLT
jgi:TatD DNase family protein